MNKMIYICSPFRAKNKEELQKNIAYAKELTRTVLLRGEAAITPHLYMTQCLNETDDKERNCGLIAGMSILRRCDGIVVGYRLGISQGMKAEIQCAKDGGMSIEFLY